MAVTCSRTVEETKKRVQDSQTSIKKKEASRKKEASKTGGGPRPDVLFKPWELMVSIHEVFIFHFIYHVNLLN